MCKAMGSILSTLQEMEGGSCEGPEGLAALGLGEWKVLSVTLQLSTPFSSQDLRC